MSISPTVSTTVSTITDRRTWSDALSITWAELLLIRRSTAVLFSAVLFPLAMSVYVVLQREDTQQAGVAMVGALSLFFVLFTIYTTVTTTIVTRRQELYLKRLRSGEASDAAVMIGMTAPAVLLCVLQLVLVLATVFAIGVQVPPSPLPVIAALVGLVVVNVLAGVATAAVTPNASAAQISTMPFILLVLGGFIGSAVAPSTWWDFTPGGAAVTLLRTGYDLPVEGSVVSALAGLVVWVVLASDLIRRRFAWEPRH